MRRKDDDHGGPFLKWAGGKAGILRFLEQLGLFPEKFAAYHEPFLGAGAVFFHLTEAGRLAESHLSDANEDLIAAFEVVRDDTEGLIKHLRKLRAAHSDEHYYEARARFNARNKSSNVSKLERAALLIYLNKTGFNGLYRVNSKGEYNVPVGRYDNPAIYSESNLRAAARHLQHATIEQRDFATVTKRARKGDFVYLDPPYVPLSQSANFTSYTKAGFGEKEQRQLAEVFADLARQGVQVMLSNHEIPLVTELYKPWQETTFSLNLMRLINSKSSRRSRPVREVVILSYPPRRKAG